MNKILVNVDNLKKQSKVCSIYIYIYLNYDENLLFQMFIEHSLKFPIH